LHLVGFSLFTLEKPCFRLIKISMSRVLRGSQDSTVRTATCHRLDGLDGSKNFFNIQYLSKLDLRLTSLLYHGYQDSLPGVKRPGHGVDHLPSSTAEIMHE